MVYSLNPFDGVFFFQAEDGIPDGHVTGVQTCALPIFIRKIALYFTSGYSDDTDPIQSKNYLINSSFFYSDGSFNLLLERFNINQISTIHIRPTVSRRVRNHFDELFLSKKSLFFHLEKLLFLENKTLLNYIALLHLLALLLSPSNENPFPHSVESLHPSYTRWLSHIELVQIPVQHFF